MTSVSGHLLPWFTLLKKMLMTAPSLLTGLVLGFSCCHGLAQENWPRFRGPDAGGVTLMPDPANFRPSWWHNRNYGLMVANPFGRKAMKHGETSRITVKKSETFRLRFSVLSHASSRGEQVDIGEAYQAFLGHSALAATPQQPVGMKLLEVATGTFTMGSQNGDCDEQSLHTVTIRNAFRIADREVSNALFEQFEPEHRQRRGPFVDDHDPAIMVSWHDAVAFGQWLSQREGNVYHLPTEAEWEYACRNHPELLRSATRVENWRLDGYGPYDTAEQSDPADDADADLRVTRGGPYKAQNGLPLPTNRSANIPEDRNRIVGFRVVQANVPKTPPRTVRSMPRWARDVHQTRWDWNPPIDLKRSWFAEPIPFVKIPAGISSRGRCRLS